MIFDISKLIMDNYVLSLTTVIAQLRIGLVDGGDLDDLAIAFGNNDVFFNVDTWLLFSLMVVTCL